ncbi:phytanoyl-CoA dioxygenase family protein [uncultured Jatrophihabitans sp.]|uniref:phytanoyl-CoA dioxygenase family protein n=1 Tax=uncultured Jatrophihabitans sp. TaxID=1610747 RepID=UPI0035CB70C7
MAVTESNPLLPEANRTGTLEQDWAGDDQQWWDWYVTLAANGADAPLVPGPGLPDVAPASDSEVAAALAQPYELSPDDVQRFAAQSFVKLPGVLTPAVVRRLAERLDELLRAEHGDDTAGRFTALEQMWRHDPLMREVALSPRLGAIAAGLLHADVRIYHDNALSKEPGCGRTPWHHDAEHFPLATLSALTAWMPMSAIPVEMGPLSFARGADLRSMLDGLEFDRVGTSYDEAVSARFAAARVAVEDGPYAVGEVSFHGATCFHTAGRNGTTQPRRALATTYFADGARVIDAPTMISGTWQEFLPGAVPGGPAATELNPVVGRRAHPH